MGNRAVIRTEANDIGIYLHWHGGRDSVETFLKYCELKGYRSPESDCYGWAYLCQVICNFFGDGLSIGIDKVECLDTNNGDNGTYIIKDWQIIGREYHGGEEQGSLDISYLLSLDKAQPARQQIGEEKIKSLLAK